MSFRGVVEAVEKAHPDVIGLEEAETNTGRLAKAAGYEYWSNAMQVVSRYPLLEPPDDEGELPVRPRCSRCCVALSNVHLPSDEPGPTSIRRGKPRASRSSPPRTEVRLPYIQGQLEVLPPLADQGIPSSCSATSTRRRTSTTPPRSWARATT